MGFMDKFMQITIPIPISASMIQQLLEKKSIDGVNELSVEIIEDYLQIRGKVKRMLITVSFSIMLKPFRSLGRILHFEVVKFTPLGSDFVKKKVLLAPPILTYNDGLASIDLNAFEAIKKIPVGAIHKFEIRGKSIWVYIGA
jgi:hypothetical protein